LKLKNNYCHQQERRRGDEQGRRNSLPNPKIDKHGDNHHRQAYDNPQNVPTEVKGAATELVHRNVGTGTEDHDSSDGEKSHRYDEHRFVKLF
jgi:hypothetical protein